MRFVSRVCVVTGAGSGIGKAVALQLAREGGKVLIVDLNEEHGQKTVQEIADAHGEARFVKCNVGVPAEVKGAIEAAVQQWQKVDVVVNDAAMMTFKPIVDLSEDEWDHVQNVNLRAVFLFCKYAVPHMPAVCQVSSTLYPPGGTMNKPQAGAPSPCVMAPTITQVQ